MSIRGKFTWLDHLIRVIEFPFGWQPCVHKACQGLPVNWALRRLLQSDIHQVVPGAVSSLLSIRQGSHSCNDLWISLEADCLNHIMLAGGQVQAGCVWWGEGGGGLFMGSIYLFFFHALSQRAVSRLITSLLLFWRLGHPGSLRHSHLGSEDLHGCFAQGQMSSEASAFLLRLSSCTGS